MDHHSPLIGTVVAGLVIAFCMGALAQRLRVSPIAGYLLAGVMVGPFTPGYVADTALANQLAEIGVILLMFGVGLHFSLKELLSVRTIAVPGAIAQIAVATLLGMGLAWGLGWGPAAGFVFGLALSVASTVVLLRALQTHALIATERGRIAVGWLIVEDLVMVLALVLLPAMARIINDTSGGGGGGGGGGSGPALLLLPLGMTFLKVSAFIGLMLVVGRRVIPSILHWAAHTGSRELFRLAVLAIALGVAFGAASLFDVSFALGAFFAGMILGETPLSRRATEETLPLRDAFAVLFFVSVGMLFDPAVVVERPLPLAGTVAIILFGKSAAAYTLVRAFGHSRIQALTIAASLAQIGEFSFILAALGTQLGLLPQEGRDLILAGAILSIFLNPFVFSLVLSREKGSDQAEAAAPADTAARPPPAPSDHIILAGYGRLGRLIAQDLKRSGQPFVVIEDQPGIARKAEADGMVVLTSSALNREALEKAGIGQAGKLLLAIPEGYEAGAIFEKARALNPAIRVIARAHGDAEAEHLRHLGVSEIVTGEPEIAARMLALCRG